MVQDPIEVEELVLVEVGDIELVLWKVQDHMKESLKEVAKTEVLLQVIVHLEDLEVQILIELVPWVTQDLTEVVLEGQVLVEVVYIEVDQSMIQSHI